METWKLAKNGCASLLAASGQPEPTSREIERELQDVELALNGLAVNEALVTDRLAPVLKTARTGDGAVSGECVGTSTPLGARLRGIRERIDGITDHLRAVGQLLEL